MLWCVQSALVTGWRVSVFTADTGSINSDDVVAGSVIRLSHIETSVRAVAVVVFTDRLSLHRCHTR